MIAAALVGPLAWALGLAAPVLGAEASRHVAHPAHATIAQAEFNAATSSLEVALRINPFDLENVLTAIEGEPVNLDTTAGVDDLISAYLNEAFVLEREQGASIELSWVGKEVFVHTAWLYFEFSLPHGPDGVRLTNRLLFELQDDQVNTVNYRRGASLKTLRHTVAEPSHELPRG